MNNIFVTLLTYLALVLITLNKYNSIQVIFIELTQVLKYVLLNFERVYFEESRI